MAKRRPSPEEEQAWAKEVQKRKRNERAVEVIEARSTLIDALKQGGVSNTEWILDALDLYLEAKARE